MIDRDQLIELCQFLDEALLASKGQERATLYLDRLPILLKNNLRPLEILVSQGIVERHETYGTGNVFDHPYFYGDEAIYIFSVNKLKYSAFKQRLGMTDDLSTLVSGDMDSPDQVRRSKPDIIQGERRYVVTDHIMNIVLDHLWSKRARLDDENKLVSHTPITKSALLSNVQTKDKSIGQEDIRRSIASFNRGVTRKNIAVHVFSKDGLYWIDSKQHD